MRSPRFPRGQTSTLVMLAALLVAALTLQGGPSWSAEGHIVVRATALEPQVFQALTGQRVNFVNRIDGPVHVEFGEDRALHQVYQIPATGPIWAIFHRPGTHPYVVHIYGARTTTVLHGVVEVAEDPQHPWGLGTCGAVVMGDCLEP